MAEKPPGKPTYEKTSPTVGASKQSIKKKKKKSKPRKSMPGVERLFADASARKNRLDQRRESLEAQNTFTPKITKLAQKSGLGAKDSAGKDKKSIQALKETSPIARSEQLYADAKARSARQAKLVEETTANEAPFKPSLSKVSSRRMSAGSKKRKPLFDPNILKERDAAREELRAKLLAEEAEKIEKTRVKRTPHASHRQKKSNAGVVARMEAAAARSKLRKDRLRQEQLAKENAACSFQPNKKTGRSGRKTPKSGGSSTFDRLYGNAKTLRQRKEQARKAKLAAEAPSFRPKIRQKDGTLRLARSKVDNSAWIDKQVKEGTEKLKFKKTAPTYKQTYEERELNAQMEELTFKPAITSPLASPDVPLIRPSISPVQSANTGTPSAEPQQLSLGDSIKNSPSAADVPNQVVHLTTSPVMNPATPQ